jgi:hypothetical protein
MKRARGTMRMTMTAILAAYLLVLQGLLGGLASGTHAGTAFALDGFGQVLCSGAVKGPASPSDPAHHTPDCCTTGCNVSVGTGTPPVAVGFEAPHPVTVAILVPVDVETGPNSTPRGLHNARAPPFA